MAASDRSRQGRRDSRVRSVTLVGITVALSYVASFMQAPISLPNGGQVSLEAIPVLTLGLLRGFRMACSAGCIEGLLHFSREPYMLTPWSLLLDYPVAQGSVACAALLAPPGVRPSPARCAVAVTVGLGAKMLVHTASGVLFFAQGRPLPEALLFSAAYNATYMMGQWALAMLVIPWLVPRLHDEVPR